MADLGTARQRVQDAIRRRRQAGETYEAIGTAIGVHWTTVWRWERGEDIRDSAAKLISLVVDDLAQQAA